LIPARKEMFGSVILGRCRIGEVLPPQQTIYRFRTPLGSCVKTVDSVAKGQWTVSWQTWIWALVNYYLCNFGKVTLHVWALAFLYLK
jgi:hypothetical protein